MEVFPAVQPAIKTRSINLGEVEKILKPHGVEVISYMPEDPPFPCEFSLRFPEGQPKEPLIEIINKAIAPAKLIMSGEVEPS